MELDHLILGSNPLFGADHVPTERTRLRGNEMTTDHIQDIILESFKSGATGFTFTNESRALGVLDSLRSKPDLPPIRLYPLVPDSSLIPSLLSKGAIRTAADLIHSLSWSSRASAVVRGGWSYLTGNPVRAAMTFLDVEVERLERAAPDSFKTPTVLLQEHFTDLALGLGLDEMLIEYLNHVKDHLGLIPGLETRNLVRMAEFLARSNLMREPILIMTPINQLGFQMCPNRGAVERALRTLRHQHIMAISILAGGVLNMAEAIDYLKTIRRIESIAVGVSSITQARITFPLLNRTVFSNHEGIREPIHETRTG